MLPTVFVLRFNCIVSGEVIHANCSCKAGKVGYCNHVLALMFKGCKFSLYDSQATDDLGKEDDEQPNLACTSQLQRWHAKGRGENIRPQPVMEVSVSKTKLDETKTREGVKSLLYEARMKPTHDLQAEADLKKTLQGINPQFGLSLMAAEHSPPAFVQTKFGESQTGSFCSYQLTHTEANFSATIDIASVPRLNNSAPTELTYPRFPSKGSFRKPLRSTISLSDILPVYNCPINVIDPLGEIPTSAFRVVWFL